MKIEATCVMEMNGVEYRNGNTVIGLHMSFEVDSVCA